MKISQLLTLTLFMSLNAVAMNQEEGSSDAKQETPKQASYQPIDTTTSKFDGWVKDTNASISRWCASASAWLKSMKVDLDKEAAQLKADFNKLCKGEAKENTTAIPNETTSAEQTNSDDKQTDK